jgi:hypothetical protein
VAASLLAFAVRLDTDVEGAPGFRNAYTAGVRAAKVRDRGGLDVFSRSLYVLPESPRGPLPTPTPRLPNEAALGLTHIRPDSLSSLVESLRLAASAPGRPSRHGRNCTRHDTNVR